MALFPNDKNKDRTNDEKKFKKFDEKLMSYWHARENFPKGSSLPFIPEYLFLYLFCCSLILHQLKQST